MADNDRERDPFEEAASTDTGDQAQSNIQLGSAMDDEPEVVEPVAPKPAAAPQPKSGKTGVFVGLGAVAVSLAALGMGGLAMQKSNSLRSDVTIAFEDVDANIASLGEARTQTDVQVNKLTEQVIDHDRAISTFDTSRIAGDVVELRDTMTRFDEDILKSRMESQLVIDQLKAELAALKTEMGTLASKASTTRPAQPAAAATTAPAKPKPEPIPTQAKLEGAEIVSMDLWGYEKHVVLMQPTGEYLTVAEGEEIMGWRYVSADSSNGRVKFMKDRRVIYVKVRS